MGFFLSAFVKIVVFLKRNYFRLIGAESAKTPAGAAGQVRPTGVYAEEATARTKESEHLEGKINHTALLRK